jgi:hypothetical protein
MALIQGKSKKSFGKNVATEESAGKPKKQSLAIAFSVQDKNKRKKFASGGPVSAKSESRPSTQDSDEIPSGAHAMGAQTPNFHDEPQANIDLVPTPEEMAMLKDRRAKMAAGGFVGSPESDWTGGYGQSADSASSTRSENMLDGHPRSHAQEKRAGTKHSDVDNEDTTGEGMLHQSLQDDEYSKEGRSNYARGGMATMKGDMKEYMDGYDDKPSSVAEAIMRKRKKFADGGTVELERNSNEDPNYEDQMSYGALRKENYSESDGLDDLDYDTDRSEGHDLPDEDENDMVGKIRSKMKSKRS